MATITHFPATSSSGSGGSFQSTTPIAYFQSIVPTLTSIWWDPVATISANLEAQTAANGGSAAITAGDGGVGLLACSTNASSTQVLRNRNGEQIINNARTSKWCSLTRCKVNVAVISGQDMHMSNILVGSNETYLGIVGATSLTEIAFVLEGGAATNTTVAFGSGYRWLAVLNDGTNIRGFANDGTASGAFTEITTPAAVAGIGSASANPRWYTIAGAGITGNVASFKLDEVILLTEPAS